MDFVRTDPLSTLLNLQSIPAHRDDVALNLSRGLAGLKAGQAADETHRGSGDYHLHAMEPAHESDPEPFGQHGVTPYLWPTFVVLCAIGVCTSLLMLKRSGNTWDSVMNTTSNRQVIVASVIGRLVIDVVPTGTNPDISSSAWDFDSRLFDSIQDGWAESWKKSVGIEWGDEAVRRFNQQPVSYWRLRIRWRTLAILYSIPVLIEIGRRIWKQYRGAATPDHAAFEPIP